MARTNIEIDEDLIGRVMRMHGLRTKKDAVDFALRRAAVRQMSKAELLEMQGDGSEMSNDEIEELSAAADRAEASGR